MKKILPDKAILVPDTATKVFTGQIFDVYQWPQELYDGSMATFEMLRRPDTVQVVAVVDGKIIMIQNGQPGRALRRTFPGGRADEDKSWLAAAQREMKEETGYSFKDWKLVDVVQPQPKIEWFVPWFVATAVINKAEPTPDAGEQISVELADFDELRQAILAGEDTTLNYALSLMQRAQTLDELIALSEFEGQKVDR